MELLGIVVQDKELLDLMDLDMEHFGALDTFFEALSGTNVSEIEEALPHMRITLWRARFTAKYGKKDLDSPGSELPSAEKVATEIRNTFTRLRREYHQRYYAPSVDDLPLFLETLEPHLGSDLIAVLMAHLDNATLPETVRTGILQLFTRVIDKVVNETGRGKQEKKQVFGEWLVACARACVCALHISRGRWGMRQFGGFWGVGAIDA